MHLAYSHIVIIQLMSSVMVWSKVITLSSTYCTYKYKFALLISKMKMPLFVITGNPIISFKSKFLSIFTKTLEVSQPEKYVQFILSKSNLA